MQAQGIQADLEGTQVQVAVRTLVAPTGRRLSKDGGRAVSSSLHQHSLGQFKVEVSCCL